MLLYQVEQATHDIFDTFPETGDDFSKTIEKLDSYFKINKDVAYEIFQFRKAIQQSGETVDQFYTTLGKLTSTCEFANI